MITQKKFIFNYKAFIYSCIFSGLFILFLIMGDNLEKYQTIWKNFNILGYLVIWGILNTFCYLTFDNLNFITEKINSIKVFSKLENIFFINNNKCFWNCFWFITICHLPAFLAYFPGCFAYDTYFQLNVFTLNNNIEIHPIIHTLMIYAVWLFEKTFQTTWLGVFIYTLIQSLITIAVYSYCIKVLSKFNAAFIIKLFSLLFFALYPTNQVFHLIATKDVYFCTSLLLFIALLTELIIDKVSFLSKTNKKTYLCLSIILMLLFRLNGLHAYLLSLPFILFYFKKDIKKIIPIFIIPLIFIIFFSIAKPFMGLTPPSSASSLAVPLQQMARVKHNHSISLSQKDKENYAAIVSKEKENLYEYWTVDNLKLDDLETQRSDHIENALKTMPLTIINLYIKWGILYPIDYIDAFLLNTYKYWYINASWELYHYPHTYLLISGIREDFYGVQLKNYSLFPQLKNFYNWLLYKNSFYPAPISTALFSFAHNTWFIFFGFMILFYQKKYNYIIALSIIPALFLTALLGPTAIIRYIWQNFLILPFLLSFCFDMYAKKNGSND